ncbi:MAG: hypothetical protein MJ175_04960 [Clostridia bacterium]|nr:hypothetical protein [Clostridia bacterium]
MKKHIVRLLFLLSFVLLLSGCKMSFNDKVSFNDKTSASDDAHENHTSGVPTYEVQKTILEHVYRLNPIVIPDGYTSIRFRTSENHLRFDIAEKYICEHHAIYDNCGNLLTVEMMTDYLSAEYAEYSILNMYFRPDGCYAIYAEHDSDKVILTCDRDGNLIYKADEEKQRTFANRILYLQNGSVLLLYSETDHDYGVLYSPESPFPNVIQIDFGAGEVYETENGMIRFGEPDRWRCFDPKTGQQSEYVGYTKSAASDAAVYTLYRGSDCYFISPEGITVQRGDGTEEMLLDWDASSLSFLNFKFYGALSDDCFLVRYTDQLRLEPTLSVLCPDSADGVRECIELTAASIGMTNDARRLAAEAILEFNRSQEEYHITLTDYDVYGLTDLGGGTYIRKKDDRSYDEFKLDIAKGIRYDIYLFGEDNPKFPQDMAKQGLFAKLSGAHGESILPNLKDLFLSSEKGDVLPLTMHLSTLLTMPEIIPDGEGITLKKLYEITEEAAGRGVISFGDAAVWDMLCGTTQYDFMDKKTGSARFDSPEYVEFMEFLTRYDERYYDYRYPQWYRGTAWGGDLVHTYSVCQYEAIPDTMKGTMPDDMVNGDYRFLYLPIQSKTDIYALYYLFRDTPYSLCGVPSEDGRTFMFTTDMSFGAGISGHKDGADAFLSFMLSDDIQTSRGIAMYSLPVTKSALSSVLEPGYGYYNADRSSYRDNSSTTITLTKICKEIDPEIRREESTMGKSYYIFNDCLEITEEFMQRWYDILSTVNLRDNGDKAVREIFDEEFSYVTGGVRTCEEAAKIIQGRVRLMINE